MTRPLSKKQASAANALTSYVEIKNIIGQILHGEEINAILDVILLHLERKLPKAQGSILLYDEEKNCLFTGAAPSLPPGLAKKIHGVLVGPMAGSCGAAAFHKRTVVVRDTFRDPLCRPYLGLVKEYNLKACWSMPILNIKGELLGTLALYYKTTHQPSEKELLLVKELADIVTLAIERDRSASLNKQKAEVLQMQRAHAINSLKDVSLGEMAKNISHEVNSPLAVILGSVHQINRMLQSDGTDPEKLKIYAARLDRSVGRIEKIVNGLRSIPGETSMAPFTKMAVNSVIADAITGHQKLFIRSDIKLIIDGELETIFECRASQISQVLDNLINNAFEAVAQTKNPWIQIHVSTDCQNIRFEITDSGHGIPAEDIERLMVPLFTTKVQANATGLGLPISKALIEEHSGRIWYDKSCQHTRFVIELPIEQTAIEKQAA